MKSYERCLNDFLCGVSMTENIDYSNMKSVRKNNSGVDKYRKNAKYIANFHPDRINDFLTLLNHENENVRVCCGVCAVELMEISENQRGVIKGIIQKHSSESGRAEQMGWTSWLEEHNLL